ncbi:unnamed protein product, partial [Didymodactylos carnosus]
HERVLGLRLSNRNMPNQIDLFLSRFSIENFNNLDCLTLAEPRLNECEVIRYSHITYLSVNLSKFNQLNRTVLSSFIFSSQTLQTCILNLNGLVYFEDDQIQPNLIKYLSINCCLANEFDLLLKHIPNIKELEVHLISIGLNNNALSSFSPEYICTSVPKLTRLLINNRNVQLPFRTFL